MDKNGDNAIDGTELAPSQATAPAAGNAASSTDASWTPASLFQLLPGMSLELFRILRIYPSLLGWTLIRTAFLVPQNSVQHSGRTSARQLPLLAALTQTKTDRSIGPNSMQRNCRIFGRGWPICNELPIDNNHDNLLCGVEQLQAQTSAGSSTTPAGGTDDQSTSTDPSQSTAALPDPSGFPAAGSSVATTTTSTATADATNSTTGTSMPAASADSTPTSTTLDAATVLADALTLGSPASKPIRRKRSLAFSPAFWTHLRLTPLPQLPAEARRRRHRSPLDR